MPKNGSGGAAQPLPQSSRTHGARKDIYLKMHRAYGTLHKAVFAARIKIYEKREGFPSPASAALAEIVAAGAMLAVARVSDVDGRKLAMHTVAVVFAVRHPAGDAAVHAVLHLSTSFLPR